MQSFSSVKDFLAYRTKCVFCNSELKPILTNFNSNIAGGIPSFKSQFKEKKFICDFTYHSFSTNIDSQIVLDVEKNNFSFKDQSVSDVFKISRPHIELYCSKRTCKTKFYVSSDILSWDKKRNKYPLHSIRLYYEAFNLGNSLWVQNDFTMQQTSIFKVSAPLTIPITVPIIDFGSLEKDALLSKLWTIVNFS